MKHIVIKSFTFWGIMLLEPEYIGRIGLVLSLYIFMVGPFTALNCQVEQLSSDLKVGD